jgi:hypothetical protein
MKPESREATDHRSNEPPSLDLQQCAKLGAVVVHFRHRNRAEVLERLGVDEEPYVQSRSHWMHAIREELELGENALAKQYGAAFVHEKEELDAERPTLESLGPCRERPTLPKPEDPGEPETGATAKAEPPVVSTSGSDGGDAPPARKLLTPSYLKQPARAIGPAREDGNEDVDRTVLGGLPSATPLPFAGVRDAPPPALSVEPAADAGGTVMVPLPAEVLSAVRPSTAAAEFDPDVTQPPMPNPLPVVPFAGTSTPERMREIAGPVREASDDAGETVALPSSEEMKSIVEAARADLPLPEYAALRAALSAHGDDSAEVLARFGLTPLQKQAIQLKYFNRFRDEPALREQFEALLRDAMRKINRGPGGR